MKKAGKKNMGFNRILLLVCVFAVSAVSAQGANLLTNGKFNTGDLTGWDVNKPNLPGVDINAVVQTATNYDGTPCLFMRYRTGGVGVEVHQVVPVTGLTTARFSCVADKWTWGSAAAEIGWYSGGVPDPNFPDTNRVSNNTFIIAQQNAETGGWGSFTYDYTVPSTAHYAILRLRASDWVWNVYFDYVYFGAPDNNQAGFVAPWPNSTVPKEDKSNCGFGPTLQWTAAPAATGNHYVYFGTSFADVNGATTSSPEYKASLPLGTTSYTLSLASVTQGQAYYWRVDETVGANIIKAENVWPFSVGNLTMLDNFNNYADDTAIQAVWGGNSAVADGNMIIDYNPAQNAVSANISALLCSNDISANAMLVLMVKGHDNMKEPNNFYVKLESNNGAQSGIVHFREPNALNQQLYEPMILWPIALQSFASQGVVLTNVTKITIGIDNGSGGPPGDTGTVTINDVRVDHPWCNSTMAELIPADFTKDCYVDMADLDLLATNWLTQSTVVTAVAPSTLSSKRILWYKFDEGSGNPADSSGNGYNGLISYPFAWGGPGSGHDGTNCFHPNNLDRVTIPIAAINDHNTIGAESTVSFWLKDPGQTDADSEILQIGRDSNVIGIWSGATGAFSYLAGWDSNNGWGDNLQYPTQQNFTNPDHPQDKWVHFAFVKNVSGYYQKIYRNGRLIALNDNATAPETTKLDTTNNFATLGAWRWSGGYGGYYDGYIDDFRIYNYALSPGEVLYLAVEGGTATSPMTQGLLTPADATGDNKVDFYDFAVMAKYWLQNVVWP